MNIKYQSQHGEDKIIVDHFFEKLSSEEKKQALIEVGANDGMTFSNTYAISAVLENKRFLVEASPKALDLWTRRRLPWDHMIKKAVVPQGEIHPYTYLYESSQHEGAPGINRGLVSSIIYGEQRRWGDTEKFKKVSVPVIKTRDLQNEFCEWAKKNDLDPWAPLMLSVDIEGMDFQFLSEWNFLRTAPIFVIAEHAQKPNEIKRIPDLMKDKGYTLVISTPENFIFAHNSFYRR